MSQTVTQNSVLSQNWVGCTGCTPNGPWLRAHYACTTPRSVVLHCVVAHICDLSWSCLGRVATCGQPCRRHVAALMRVLARRVAAPLGHDTSLYRNIAPCRASYRAHATPYRGASYAVSQPVSLPLLRPKCRPKPQYNLCNTTLSAS